MCAAACFFLAQDWCNEAAIKVNATSPQVAQLSKAMSDVPYGGQILIDSVTFNSVNSSIAELGKLLAPRPDFESLNRHVRHRWSSCRPHPPFTLQRYTLGDIRACLLHNVNRQHSTRKAFLPQVCWQYLLATCFHTRDIS